MRGGGTRSRIRASPWRITAICRVCGEHRGGCQHQPSANQTRRLQVEFSHGVSFLKVGVQRKLAVPPATSIQGVAVSIVKRNAAVRTISCKSYPAESPSPVTMRQSQRSLLGICVRGISASGRFYFACFAHKRLLSRVRATTDLRWESRAGVNAAFSAGPGEREGCRAQGYSPACR